MMTLRGGEHVVFMESSSILNALAVRRGSAFANQRHKLPLACMCISYKLSESLVVSSVPGARSEVTESPFRGEVLECQD